MSILISPSEPTPIADLGSTSSLPEQYGCDILFPGAGFIVGVQRKQFPNDFAASLSDGRFAKFAAQMGNVDFGIVLIEGSPMWTSGGVLIHDHIKMTKRQVWGIRWSLQLKGLGSMWTSSLAETCEYIDALKVWVQKPSHRSLDKRPGPRNEWGSARNRDWQRHLLQGFPGIGPELADRIIDARGGVPLSWTVTPSELAAIEGLGPKRIGLLMKALEREEANVNTDGGPAQT